MGVALAVSTYLGIKPMSLIENRPEVQRAVTQIKEDLQQLRLMPGGRYKGTLLLAATVAYEDRSYMIRPRWLPPLSPVGIARALIKNLQGVQHGGSTIPQQLAKLYLVSADKRRTVKRKLVEAALATWMTRQASREEILLIYLNMNASLALGGSRSDSGDLDRLSLAMFGLPADRLGREDQLVLAGTPRGLGVLRTRPTMSLARLLSAKKWLEGQGLWDSSRPSFLDHISDREADMITYSFISSYKEMLATHKAGSTDLDLVLSVDGFRRGLAREMRRRFPDLSVRAAFSVIAPDGKVLARSGSEAFGMYINYGSIAKLEPLVFASEVLGVEAIRKYKLPATSRCVRWFWTRRRRPALWCPTDITVPDRPMSMDRATALSINSMVARHAMLLPLRVWRVAPVRFMRVLALVSPSERRRLDSDADRAISANLMTSLGRTTVPNAVPAVLSYSAMQVAFLRHLRTRRQEAGLPSKRLPDDPTQLVGNSSRATTEQVGAYIHRRLFTGGEKCKLSDTGTLLALHREEGTLRWLSARHPDLMFSGKTGTSPHNDGAMVAVALCLDGRPVVLVAGVRPVQGKLPDGFYGSILLRGVHGQLLRLRRLQRRISSPRLADWAKPLDKQQKRHSHEMKIAHATGIALTNQSGPGEVH